MNQIYCDGRATAEHFAGLLNDFSKARGVSDLEDTLGHVLLAYNLQQVTCVSSWGETNVAISSPHIAFSSSLLQSQSAMTGSDQPTLAPGGQEFRRARLNLFTDISGSRRIGRMGLRFRLCELDGMISTFLATTDFSEREWELMKAIYLRDLYVIASITHRKLVSFAENNRRQLFSPRERECLQAVAVGRRPKQIAGDLQISEHAVRLYLKRARRKLGARNLIEAVGKSLQDGHIEYLYRR
ncbi:LuxR C-terminal-related transcriptional regulator [Pararhizobium sp. BT-229]|uniref:helix-turn-helix transcriptional regulator n=1 Tax=Pararhizobium sp. BT-229 TaxID=2986923 RepID=UPI0021F6B12F|nr:LuxR family transcriptional regulator [Pararhizobium sp. BT-229]MCV9967712.1 LuxR C-terminal-related transcriptional regulator [Pararhizobium sp. BT-229]